MKKRDLPVGYHHIRIAADGYAPWTGVVRIVKGREYRMAVQLKSTEKRRMFDDARRRLPVRSDGVRFPESVRTIAAVAAVRHIIVFSLERGNVWAALFDVNRQKTVRMTEFAKGRLPLLAVADQVVERLYDGLNRRMPSMTDAVIPVGTKIKSQGTPWWVWVSVGVGAAAAIIIPTVLLLDSPDGVSRTSNTGTVIVEF